MNNHQVRRECQTLLPQLQRLAPEYAGFAMLNAGGFACAIGAAHRSTGARAVFKVLRQEFIDKWDLLERFTVIEREACRRYGGLLGAVDEPDADPPLYCNVLKHVPGEQLNRIIVNQRRSTRERLQLFIALARCVAKIHRLHIAHRDLNPNNILVEGLTPEVIDFGSAKLTDHHDERTRVAEGARNDGRLIIAQTQFAAPEVLHSLSRGTMRSDVYSLGMLGYYILTNTYPYVIDFEARLDEDFDRVRTTAEAALRQYKSPRTVNPEIPESVDQILRGCLMIKPDDRFDSGMSVVYVLEKADQLGRLWAGLGGGAPGPGPRPPSAPDGLEETDPARPLAQPVLIIRAQNDAGATVDFEIAQREATIGFGDTVQVDLSPLVPDPPDTGAFLAISTIGRKLLLKRLPGGDAEAFPVALDGEAFNVRHQRFIAEGLSVLIGKDIALTFVPPWTGDELHDDTACAMC